MKTHWRKPAEANIIQEIELPPVKHMRAGPTLTKEEKLGSSWTHMVCYFKIKQKINSSSKSVSKSKLIQNM